MRYDSLIFDIDGTLWDSRSLVAQGYNRQLAEEGLERFSVTVDQLKGLFGKVLPEIADILFGELPEPERAPLIYRCTASQDRLLHESPCKVGYPRVRETLEALAKDHRLFIVSNSEQGYPELCMEKLGLSDLFEDHLCFGDTHTPKGRTIRTMIERHGLQSPAYIGDTQGDYEATVDAGIPITSDRSSRSDVRKYYSNFTSS